LSVKLLVRQEEHTEETIQHVLQDNVLEVLAVLEQLVLLLLVVCQVVKLPEVIIWGIIRLVFLDRVLQQLQEHAVLVEVVLPSLVVLDLVRECIKEIVLHVRLSIVNHLLRGLVVLLQVVLLLLQQRVLVHIKEMEHHVHCVLKEVVVHQVLVMWSFQVVVVEHILVTTLLVFQIVQGLILQLELAV